MHHINKLVFALFLSSVCPIALAQQPSFQKPAGMHVHILHHAHVSGKVMNVGSATGKDGKMHMMILVKLDSPLQGGGETVAATVTHNEQPQKVQTSLVTHAASVDITCPKVRVVSYKAIINAYGQECTLNSYNL